MRRSSRAITPRAETTPWSCSRTGSRSRLRSWAMSTAEPLDIRRGDVLWVSCDPSVGAEPRKTRTCVVVSNDIANRFAQVITVIPTQKYTAERAARAYIVDLRQPRSDLKDARVANASMVMTYDKARIVK